MSLPRVALSRRPVLKGLLAATALAAAPGWAVAAGADPARPWTIPALREWKPRPGGFRLAASTRVVVRPGSAQRVMPVATVFGEDLSLLVGRQVPVVVVDQPPGPGDIALDLQAIDPQLGEEGYRLLVGDAVRISAVRPAGAFYGTRSLLQILGQGQASVPGGEARDWPRYPERGFMIDCARKYFTPGWLERHVRELAFLKLNRLHLHLTDDQGFRIGSDSHPEIVSDEYLTKSEAGAIVELAARYHITVVPEIEMPGHMGAALARHPEHRLPPDPRDTSSMRNGRLDVTSDAA
ncbi:beta-N-acetylhexosaminidase, partial [Streptomyces sp. B1866]|uniref:beta-N-acetylhexosaminidase n=1 Tax=Streptomyces sp. B1866 TaxID=3075431 RepID=UPI0028922282